MKFQRSAPRVLIFSVVVVVIGMAVLSNRLFSGLTSAVEEDQFELIRALWSFNLTAAENRALERAEMIAAMPAVREAFAARDREALLAQCAEMFKRQKERYGVDQAQFHFPPAISFLRLHAPEQHGDHQDQFRPMVVAVNRDRFSRKESAIAATGPAIFGVTPMTDAAGEHIGSFELGMNFGPLLHALKAAYSLEMALFIEEQPLRQLMFAEGLSPEFLTEENRRGKYIKVHSTNWALMKELVGEGDLSGPAEAQVHTLGAGCAIRRGFVDAVQQRGRSDRQGLHGAGFQQLEGGSGPLVSLAGSHSAVSHRALGGYDPDCGTGPAATAFGNVEPAICQAGRGAARSAHRRNREPLRGDEGAGKGSRAAQNQAAALRRNRQRGLSMRGGLLAALALSLALALPGRAELPEAATTAPPESLSSLPTGKGLPVVVRMGLRYVEVTSIDEAEATYTATVDLRLRWQDLRLQYPPESAPEGFLQFRDEAATAKMAQIWTPAISLWNLSGEPSQQMHGLRIFPDGRVEMILRTRATFETPFDVERFPFDRQGLQVEVVSSREGVQRLSLEFEQDDLDFSQAPASSELPDWVSGVVSLKRDLVNGWYGEYLARATVSLAVQRRAARASAPIFIPLLASLLIPLVAIWMNRIEDGEFQIEAFEQANVIVGGLFAVVALNFTLNAEYGALSSSDNTVRRLLALNYLALALSLVINLTLFRFNLPMRWFGRYVQEQVFLFLSWAVPLLVLATAVATLLVAMA